MVRKSGVDLDSYWQLLWAFGGKNNRGEFSWVGWFSRGLDRTGSGDPARPVISEKPPDPTPPDPWDFQHLLARPGSMRVFLKRLLA